MKTKLTRGIDVKVTVKQISSMRDVGCLYDEDKRIEYVRANLDMYDEVANFYLKERMTNSDLLNHTFYMTNSVESAWFENKELNVAENAICGCRSTSVGDIIEVEDNDTGVTDVYMVAGCGFMKV